jgi:two-component system sensor histidine kinase KdpD
MSTRRPDPDALLQHIAATEASPRKGRLKVFIGATAGVGKTYAMVEAALQRRREGIDVIAGVVETHGRRETQSLVDKLDLLPRRLVDHRGLRLGEFDLDGALSRAPALILVDELAHTNAPGSRHEKRWQDIQELREAGIDVYTTVNVQHLESVNDVVARITHVRVRETVPDAVLEGADEVELVDLPPGELLKRLDEGKIYLPEQVARARQHFFRRGNLIALRQLALRYTAEHVDTAMEVYRRAHAVRETWPVAERLLVGVGPAPSSRRLVRAAKRMADRLGAEWHVIFVETPEYAGFSEPDRQRVWETLRLARDLGADASSISGSGTDALLEYARKHNVTRIIVGKPSHTRLRDRLLGSRLDELVRASGDIDVYVISGDEVAEQRERTPDGRPFRLIDYSATLLVVAAMTAGAILLRERLELANLVMLYLLGVVGIAVRFGRGPSILASILSVAAFDWFCVPPYGTFQVADGEYIVVFAVMLVVALLIATLTTQLRRQASASRRREERTASLFAITRELVGPEEAGEIATVTTRHMASTFAARARLLGPDPFGALRDLESDDGGGPLDPVVATWVRERGRPAGPGTGTLPDARALYVPVMPGPERQAVAVAELSDFDIDRLRDPEQMQLLETFARQSGAALERVRLAADSRRAQQLVEMDRLKSQFVAVAAHELRTPLTSLGMAVELLAERLVGQASQDERTTQLFDAALDDVHRLRTLVEDLLDLSRLESRSVTFDAQRVAPGDIVLGAVEAARLSSVQTGARLTAEIGDGIPDVSVDPDHIQRALTNLVHNALRHAGNGGHVLVSADALPDFVQISVADDGPGVPVADQERVFVPFVGGDGEGRSGLGLAIAREIIRAHGGDIWVDSGPGPGAVFSFTVPIAQPHESGAGEAIPNAGGTPAGSANVQQDPAR